MTDKKFWIIWSDSVDTSKNKYYAYEEAEKEAIYLASVKNLPFYVYVLEAKSKFFPGIVEMVMLDDVGKPKEREA